VHLLKKDFPRRVYQTPRGGASHHHVTYPFTEYEYVKESPDEPLKIFHVPESLNYKQILKNTAIGCLTVVIDKDIIGDFRMPLVRRGQDYLTWVMILQKGHIAHGLKEDLDMYRRVQGSLSHNEFQALGRQWNNYRKEIKLSLPMSAYDFGWYVLLNVKKYYFTR
jgi:teichuronic acid biosynthesis glycosyltransferase TuaG